MLMYNRLISLHWQQSDGDYPLESTLNMDDRHDVNFVATGDTGSCPYHNSWCPRDDEFGIMTTCGLASQSSIPTYNAFLFSVAIVRVSDTGMQNSTIYMIWR